MNDKLIISKYKELVEKLDLILADNDFPDNLFPDLREELSLLQEQGEKKEPSVNFMQIRELTDEEWLKLPKEEILQLYKNCYSMLQGYLQPYSLSNNHIPLDQSGIREDMITPKGFDRNQDDNYEAMLIRVGRWMNTQGWELNLSDDLWMEDTIFSDIKVRDFCEMVNAYSESNK